MQTVHVQKDFSVPPERVFAYLSEHENLGVVFAPAKVERIREGETEPNGTGSVRRLSFFGALPFEETVTAVDPNERIEYEITKGTPLRAHHGTMLFTPNFSGGTHLDYTITFDAPVPGLAATIAMILRRNIAKGLAKVDASL
ncbi:MAG: SRPBCC family protein [Actinomycetota bacterium]|nr:SRPBCC family protein [Actinomycetota bacterium]